MVNALNTAVSAGVDGIAVCLFDQTAFNEPVERALQAGIPVVSTMPTLKATSDSVILVRTCSVR